MNRRHARTRFTLVVAIVALIALPRGGVSIQGEVQPANDLPNPYDITRNWGVLPNGRTWGSTSAINVDRDGRSIWVAERCGANSCAGSNLPVVLKFDASGTLVRSFGAGMFIFPHGIHVDRDGNVWVTDARSANREELKSFPDARGKGHQVVKFSPEGKILLTLGRAGVAGDPPDYLSEPCDVITAPNGDIFVAEGHRDRNPRAPRNTVARIVKFSKDGRFIKSWGKLGSGPGEFRTPHALAFDSRGRLFVADRGNMRIQIFDQEGNLLQEWKQFSRVSGLHIDRDDVLYAIDSESNATNHPGWRQGVRIGSAKNGKVTFFIPGHQTDLPEGVAGEGVTVDADGHVYVAEKVVRGVTKYVKRSASR